MLSGDTLFVGDIARPDLAVEKEEGAHGIFHSLHDKLLALPGECEVWPGHVGGSLCGGPAMDMKVSSTIAFERRHNRLLQLEDEDAFVRAATAQLRPQPPNFKEIVAINRGPLRTDGFDPPAAGRGRRGAKAGNRRAPRRRPRRRRLRRGPHSRSGVQPRGARRLRDQAGVDRQPRSGDHARRRGRLPTPPTRRSSPCPLGSTRSPAT